MIFKKAADALNRVPDTANFDVSTVDKYLNPTVTLMPV